MSPRDITDSGAFSPEEAQAIRRSREEGRELDRQMIQRAEEHEKVVAAALEQLDKARWRHADQ